MKSGIIQKSLTISPQPAEGTSRSGQFFGLQSDLLVHLKTIYSFVVVSKCVLT